MMQRTGALLFLGVLAVPACGGGGGGGAGGTSRFVTVSPRSLPFAAQEGGADPADQTVTLKGTSLLLPNTPWAAVSDNPWLTVTPDSGDISPGEEIILTLHVNAAYQIEGWVGATATTGAPTARRAHSAAWTGTQMVVWSGSTAATPNTQEPSGGRYAPPSWLGTVSTTGMPAERHLHSAVWTGTEMIVWGGWKFGVGFFNTGGRYAPDAWTASTTETIGAPTAREAHSAVWTGSRMIVWGGWDGSAAHQDGNLYDPATDTWTGSTSTTGAPTARQDHVAVWTGDQMVIWGGRTGTTDATNVNTGGLYDPGTDTWTAATSTTGAPAARASASGVWTGRELIVWGGTDALGAKINTGGRFDPVTNGWLGALPTAGAPVARKSHRAVWTGTQMIVWGGDDTGGSLNTGGIYEPPIPAQGTNVAVVTITPAVGNPVNVTVTLTITP